MFWVNYGDVADACEGQDSEEFEQASTLLTLSIIAVVSGIIIQIFVRLCTRKNKDEANVLSAMSQP